VSGTAAATLLAVTGVLAWGSGGPLCTVTPQPVAPSQVEQKLRRSAVHISEFSPVSEPLALPKCGSVRPPEALLTPDPLLRADDGDLNVKVSFIVGADGHVHSPFVLDSGGPVEDQMVLRSVRFWRYRPALCNGVATDSEAQVRFHLH
jgi:outer membrane biosynthesis protein TonB